VHNGDFLPPQLCGPARGRIMPLDKPMRRGPGSP
jgi:hypothetical protein